MADVFKTPGVYVKEIPTFPPSIAEVETAIPAFIGYTEKASFNGIDLVKKPTRITSLLEYETIFGKAQKERSITVTITDMMDGTAIASRSIKAESDEAKQSKFKMYYSLQMFFANGGGPCYIVSVGTYENKATAPAKADIDKDKLSDGLAEIAKFDEPTLLVFPDATTLDNDKYSTLLAEALKQCADLQDRFTVMDVKPDKSGTNVVNDSMNDFRNTQMTESVIDKLKYGAAYFPYINTSLNFRYDDSEVSVTYQQVTAGVSKTLTNADDNADGDAADIENIKLSHITTPLDTLDVDIVKGLNLMKNPQPNPAPPKPVVAPNTELYNLIKGELSKVTITLPPSGAVVGQYASVDSARGVWKAPANVSLSSVSSAAIKISHNDQMNLNVDPTSGKSINAIRYFTGKGLLIWGSRTLAGNDNEWRYVPVRRFFNFAEESIKKGSEWVVFEPNDANTWVRVRTMIQNFLNNLWRQGAFAGAKPEDAYFVNIGLGETMTAQDILEGKMIVEVGVAAVRPAEFIVLRFMHKLQVS